MTLAHLITKLKSFCQEIMDSHNTCINACLWSTLTQLLKVYFISCCCVLTTTKMPQENVIQIQITKKSRVNWIFDFENNCEKINLLGVYTCMCVCVNILFEKLWLQSKFLCEKKKTCTAHSRGQRVSVHLIASAVVKKERKVSPKSSSSLDEILWHARTETQGESFESLTLNWHKKDLCSSIMLWGSFRFGKKRLTQSIKMWSAVSLPSWKRA